MSDFIEDFEKATANYATSPLYRRWAGLSVVAALMERKVHTFTISKSLPLYANQFIILVGSAGSGKSLCISKARSLLERSELIKMGPDRVTSEKLIQIMSEPSPFMDLESADVDTISVLSLALSEFGSLLRKADVDYMTALCQLWDCQETFEAATISRNFDKLKNVCLNILAGTQQAFFSEGFPIDAFERGLPARLILVYGPEQPHPELFPDNEVIFPEEGLQARMREIHAVKGEIPFSRATQATFKQWLKDGYAPVPDDPLLKGYNVRRHMHVAKAALCFAMARHPKSLRIEEPDFESAKALLIETEKGMTHALMAAGGNVFRLREEMIIEFVTDEWTRSKQAIEEYRIRERLGRMMQPQMVMPVISSLLMRRALKALPGREAPFRLLMPYNTSKKK